MTRPEITEKLETIFRDLFEDPAIVVTDAMTAKDVKKWDSISHIDMICAVEKSFKIRLTTRQVAGLKTVGELITLIEQKTPGS
jgi:acyl carrier protein